MLLARSYQPSKRYPDGYNVDRTLSGRRVQVYHTDTGRAVVVHRGTQGMHDVLTDGLASLGIQTRRFRHAQKIQKKAESKYGGSGNVTTVGHSLGGLIAERVANKNSDVITYNKAALPKDSFQRIKKNQTDIRTTADLVSWASTTHRGGSSITIKSDTKNPLAEHSTDVLSKLGDIDV